MQSELELHAFPEPHFKQLAPPQSTSDSDPSFIALEQDAAMQVLLTQFVLEQSPPMEQVLNSPHFAAHEPPQSISVSVPFFTLSKQVAAWQRFPVQTPLKQSADELQLFEVPHFEHEPP
ncbi:MAG TPA: hypothetical protein PL169_13965, partial [Leptospiraceae bacterium]|nr:hypothetical protein [Leptospiraceae bacterium]